jgi:fucose permease
VNHKSLGKYILRIWECQIGDIIAELVKNPTMSRRTSALILILVCYAQFIVLGLPGGFLGAAWPSMQTGFGLPLDEVGKYLLVNTLGYTLASFFSAQIATRIGFSRFLLLAALVFGTGFLGLAFAPAWGWVLVFGLLTGLGGGAIDASLNLFMSARSSSMLVNWLHASYGIGATLGPIGLSFLLTIGQTWRTGYQVMAILQVGVVAAVLLTLNRWEGSHNSAAATEMIRPSNPARLRETLAVPAVWLAMLLFFVYTGAEMTAGQWAFSLFTLSRHISETAAGWWTGLFWASFTIGRIFLGVLIDRFGFEKSMRVMISGIFLGAVLLWWSPQEGFGFVGLALMGFAMAPIFPTLIAMTPRLLGNRQATNAIGMQVAFGGLGVAALPWLAGILAARTTLEVISPFILVECLIMLLLFELLLRRRIN